MIDELYSYVYCVTTVSINIEISASAQIPLPVFNLNNSYFPLHTITNLISAITN